MPSKQFATIGTEFLWEIDLLPHKHFIGTERAAFRFRRVRRTPLSIAARRWWLMLGGGACASRVGAPHPARAWRYRSPMSAVHSQCQTNQDRRQVEKTRKCVIYSTAQAEGSWSWYIKQGCLGRMMFAIVSILARAVRGQVVASPEVGQFLEDGVFSFI